MAQAPANHVLAGGAVQVPLVRGQERAIGPERKRADARLLVRELGDEGVRVNGVRPGLIVTDIHASGGEPDRAYTLGATAPMRRPGRPEEVAAAICWLLDDDAASYVTGALLDVSGGR